jgi:hypothetical protein
MDGAIDEGQECYRIELENATLYYQKEAGGFSSIIDKDGNDWIGFKRDSVQGYPTNASSEYRGLPNLVFRSDDSGVGHPGFDKCVSEKINDYQIRTTSRSGKWQWTWTFFHRHVELLVDKTDPNHSYWFLYEGIPGGQYRPQFQYWGTDKIGPDKSIPDYFFGNADYDTWQWVYFGDESVDRVFYVVQERPDNLTDTFSYLGNTNEGVISPDGMVVFGFGRDEDAKSLFTAEKQKFFFGFKEGGIKSIDDHVHFKSQIEHLISH